MSKVVRVEKTGGVCIITLNRPQAANALNREMARSLRRIVAETDTDGKTRVMVVTGAGGKAFCSGMDLKERGGMSED